MKIDVAKFSVKPGKNVRLKHWPTEIKALYDSKEDGEEKIKEHVKQLQELQGRLYADGRHAALIILQAMDAGGKDSAIKHVMSGVNPQGCQVVSFKAPSAEELGHDFLWRTTRQLPPRGDICIFNRSYYEEVLIVRVHPDLLAKQRLPEKCARDKDLWKHRYHSINEFEKHLARNGTKIIKLFLHISKGEQRKRFLSRIEEPEKNWKITPEDVRERGHWHEYTKAYEHCLAATSTEWAPWHVAPADDKMNARLIISRIIVESLKELKIAAPQADPARRRELATIKRALK
ncbi:MAG TPA: polyphosphate kinase 2 family protein [Verrucomicrobiae bacterium]|jgi:PPK2 family polyphosphate:nucleotide phosphotransferase|nr:polyphosphate kinase 2 family protein [Verrucomicrobiae bacterium]